MSEEINIYLCEYIHCNTKWELFLDSGHNDRCPVCNKEIEPKYVTFINDENYIYNNTKIYSPPINDYITYLNR